MRYWVESGDYSKEYLRQEIENLTANEETFAKNGKDLKKQEYKILRLFGSEKEKTDVGKDLAHYATRPCNLSITSLLQTYEKP